MEEFVKIIGEDIFTNSMVTAKEKENKHESVQWRIKDYKKELLTLGKLDLKSDLC